VSGDTAVRVEPICLGGYLISEGFYSRRSSLDPVSHANSASACLSSHWCQLTHGSFFVLCSGLCLLVVIYRGESAEMLILDEHSVNMSASPSPSLMLLTLCIGTDRSGRVNQLRPISC
jgi:hypothetical protein